jgi:hypothetical protein
MARSALPYSLWVYSREPRVRGVLLQGLMAIAGGSKVHAI